MNATTLRTLAASAAFAAATGAPLLPARADSSVSYRNDFTTRTSSYAIPEPGVWHSATPYPGSNNEIYAWIDPSSATAKRNHGYGFSLYGQHRYVFFHDFFVANVFGGRPTCDGWFRPNWRRGTASSGTDGYSAIWMHRAAVAFDQGNPCFRFQYDTATARQGYALHSIHNCFTNGQLKIQVDMRAPLQWRASNVRHFMVFPVYEKYMHCETWDAANCTGLVSPGKFGFRCGGSNFQRSFPMYYDARKVRDGTTSQLGNNYNGSGSTEGNCYWFRFEVTYDLDAARFSGTVKSLDSAWATGLVSDAGKIAAFNSLAHPTFDTAVPASPLKSEVFNNALWIGCAADSAGNLTTDMDALWADKGGISGLGIFTGQLAGTETLTLQGSGNNTTNLVLVDNIRVSWKAPAAADFEVCYENDFAMRSYRTLSAPFSTTGGYAPKTESKADYDVFTGYTAGALDTYNILPTLSNTTDAGEPGVDGWRRHYADGHANVRWAPMGVESNTDEFPGSGGNKLAFAWNNAYVIASQPLGASFTTGKITLTADVFLPGEWSAYTWIENRNRAMIGLGSAALHTASTADFPDGFAAAFGYRKVKSDSDYAWEPFKTFDGTGLAGDSPSKNAWYRYELAADLDARTYDVTVTPLGTSSVAAGTAATQAAVFSQAGIPFDNDVSDIGSFALMGYGYGNAVGSDAKNKRVAFDNISVVRAWTEDGVAKTRTVYSNDFSTRVRDTGVAVPRATSYLAYEYDNDDGPDHWIRQDGTGDAFAYAVATVRDDGGNSFASFGAERDAGQTARYGHVFGGSASKGVFSFRVDIRPPSAFKARNGLASLTLGGRSLEQLQTLGYDNDRMLEFGFRGTNTSYVAGIGEKPAPFVGGTALAFTQPLDASHWYRFEIKGKMDADTCKVRVYDMGAGHPAESAPNGTPVAAANDLVPEKAFSTGISAFYVTASQVGHTPGETGVDPAQMLVDNIVFESGPIPAFVIMIH